MVKKLLFKIFPVFILSFILTMPLLASDIDFTLQDLNGKTVNLSDYKGKNVILFFWAVYCPACRGSLEKAERLFNDIGEDAIVLLSINIRENKDRIKSFIKNKQISYPILLDSNSNVARRFGLVGIPTFIFINKEGNIINQSYSLPDDIKSVFGD